MDSATTRQPYQPPQITRVVLRREQAVLSQCTLVTNSARDNLTGGCVHRGRRIGDDVCKGWGNPGGDSGGRPS